MNLGLASRAEVPEVWAKHRDALLGAVLLSENFSEADILHMLLSGHMHLWHCDKAAAVTEIITYPRRKVCSIKFAGGEDMGAWLHFIHEIEAWARAQGCAAIAAIGREGWSRALGWEVEYTVSGKTL